MSYLKLMIKVFLLLLVLFWFSFFLRATPLSAQNLPTEKSFAYSVQPDDTLILVALHYNLTLTEIILANELPAPFLIFPGQHLVLPGIAPPPLALNELPPLRAEPHIVQPGDTLFTISQQYGVSMGAITLVNPLSDPDVIQVGQILQIPESPPVPKALPPPFTEVILSEPTIIQGRTLVVKVSLSEPASLTGIFEGRPLFFAEDNNGHLWTIIAIHALTEPNLYPLTLSATLVDGSEINTFVNLEVVEGPYWSEDIELDATRGELLAEDLIEQEQQLLATVWSQISPQPRWQSSFYYPVQVDTLKITSYFGTRRSYNGGPTTSFHGGTDFGGGVGTGVYAPAAGTVVLAEKLTIRGNAVVIDHGMGLFSGYWHQSQLTVVEGQEVQAGDLIGYLGNTGLVTGPHLHWEMRLQGIAVDPMQWIQQTIP
jgi:murein DD-endopeptidase MepM/ murein hydrolase activator NlpD